MFTAGQFLQLTSTIANWESRPSKSNMIKKRKEKNGAAGKSEIASGYAINAKPGPDATTWSTLTQFLKAMCPRNENTANPAKTKKL